jgi:sugar phosphate permease
MDRLAWANVAVTAAQSLGLTVATLGSFVTAFYVGYIAANAFGGFFTDLLGGRLMVSLALIPLGIFTFLFGRTTSITYGLIIQAIMGVAAGADYAASIKLMAGWFGMKNRGRAMGLYLTGTSFGVMLTNAIVPTFLKFFGWHGAYYVLGIITTAFGIACFILLRNPISEDTKKQAKPDFRLLLRNRDLRFLALAGFGGYWGAWGFAFWANALMIKGYHLSAVQAGLATAMFGIGAIIGKPLIGLLSDLLGGVRKVPAISCLLGFSASLLVFGCMHDYRSFLIVAPFLGLTSFTYTPLLASSIAEAAGQNLAGSATGLTNTMWQLGNVIVPLVVGSVFQRTHSFFAAFAILAAGPVVGAVAMAFVNDKIAAAKPKQTLTERPVQAATGKN